MSQSPVLDNERRHPEGSRPAARWSDATMARLAYAGLTGLSVLAAGIILAAPWLEAHGYDQAALVVYGSFHPLCHQLPARSFVVWGHPLAVCSRCSSLVFGGLLGLLLVPLLRSLRHAVPKRRWLAIAAAACAVDVGLGWLGLPNTFASRAASGGLLGATMAFYLVPAVVQATLSLCGRSPPV